MSLAPIEDVCEAPPGRREVLAASARRTAGKRGKGFRLWGVGTKGLVGRGFSGVPGRIGHKPPYGAGGPETGRGSPPATGRNEGANRD